MFGMNGGKELLRAYRMYQKMMQYPHLLDDMRAIFISALETRGVTDRAKLEAEARFRMEKEGISLSAENRKDYLNLLIDLYFANHFSDEDIENHINLARKEDRFRNLHRVVNAEGATAIRIKRALKEFCDIPQGDLYIHPNEAEGVRVALINHFISNQLPFIGIAKRYITIRDIDEILGHSFPNPRIHGRFGGKAAGMLLAYKIILPRLTEKDPDFQHYVDMPESYYFDSGIFSDFIDHNGLYRFHSQKYKTYEAIEEEYKTIAQLFQKASYPPDIVDMFREFIDQMGEHPLILRSSSLLEDNFGYTFSGKYDSVFLANQGTLDERLDAFIWGLKLVHMSTFAPAPILYRRDHDLLDFDEKMSVLVQRVIGKRVGKFFFPFSAGVAFSRNPIRWTPRIRKEDGIVRLVLGLGTRAVDRVGGDYPRMIPLSHPLLRPEVSAAKITKYSQKMADVLNLETGKPESVSIRDILPLLSNEERFHAVSVNKEGHMSAPLFIGEASPVEKACVTYENLLKKTPFVSLMKKILRKLEEAYGRPVDVEFAWDQEKLYILQCRTLSISVEIEKVAVPTDVPNDAVVFTNTWVVANAVTKDIEYLVYVDPKAYAALPGYEEKSAIGRVVSHLNRVLDGKRYGIFGPGRWGSNDINLGVQVGYEDINRTRILGEIAFEEDGATPEVSSGTHFFNDLVEAKITPLALFPDQPGTIFREDLFLESANQLAAMAPQFAPYSSVVHVIHIPRSFNGRFLHVYQDSENQQGIGFLGDPEVKNA